MLQLVEGEARRLGRGHGGTLALLPTLKILDMPKMILHQMGEFVAKHKSETVISENGLLITQGQHVFG